MNYLNEIDFTFGDNSLLSSLKEYCIKNQNFNINEQDEVYLRTGLHLCVKYLNIKSFDWFIENNINLNITDTNGNTVIHDILIAANKDFMDINIEENLNMLKSSLKTPFKIDFEIENNRGQTILELAKPFRDKSNKNFYKLITEALDQKIKLIEEMEKEEMKNRIKKDILCDLNDDMSFL